MDYRCCPGDTRAKDIRLLKHGFSSISSPLAISKLCLIVSPLYLVMSCNIIKLPKILYDGSCTDPA